MQIAKCEENEHFPRVFHVKDDTNVFEKIINIYDTQHVRLPVITAYLQTSKGIDNDLTYISGTGRPSARKRPPLSHNLIFSVGEAAALFCHF